MNSLIHTALAVLIAAAMGVTGPRSAAAQSWFELGVKGGLALANLSSTTPLSSTTFIDGPTAGGGYAQGSITSGLGDMKAGFTAGAYGAAHLSSHFGLRIETLYVSKGTTGKASGTLNEYDATNTLIGAFDVSGTNTLTLAYLEIPILAVVSFPDHQHGEFQVFAGPALAFKSKAEIHQKITLSYFGQSQSASATQDLGDHAAGTDVGGVIGVGYSHRARAVVITGDARWTQGFSSVDDAEQGWKNHAFALSLGVGVPIGAGR